MSIDKLDKLTAEELKPYCTREEIDHVNKQLKNAVLARDVGKQNSTGPVLN